MILHFFTSWLLNAAVLMLTANIVSGIEVRSFGAALLGALAIGVVNVLVKPVLVILSLPITILTLGLFLFVVTGISFWLAAKITPGFEVHGLGSAIIGALVLSLLNWGVSILFYRKSF